MKTDECPTTPDYYVDVTVERTACKKHQARKGESCWLYLSAVTNTYVRAVCNQRARAAGMTARISTKSLTVYRKNRD